MSDIDKRLDEIASHKIWLAINGVERKIDMDNYYLEKLDNIINDYINNLFILDGDIRLGIKPPSSSSNAKKYHKLAINNISNLIKDICEEVIGPDDTTNGAFADINEQAIYRNELRNELRQKLEEWKQ